VTDAPHRDGRSPDRVDRNVAVCRKMTFNNTAAKDYHVPDKR
jgi:hypothetical protein